MHPYEYISVESLPAGALDSGSLFNAMQSKLVEIVDEEYVAANRSRPLPARSRNDIMNERVGDSAHSITRGATGTGGRDFVPVEEID